MYGLLNFCLDPNFGSFNPKKWAKYQNNYQFINTFINYLNIALDQFEWENLPDSCDSRILELALINKGMAGFFDDSDYGFLTLPATGVNNLNIYGYYDRLIGYGMNGYNREFRAYIPHSENIDAKAVPIYDNDMRYPFLLYIIQMSERITSAIRSIDVAATKLKNPYMVTCDSSQQSSVREVFKAIDNNEQIIITSKSLTPNDFQIIPTHQDVNSVEALWQHYHYLDNDIRTTLGIQNNPSADKKERLLTDEISSNDMITSINAKMRLKCRQDACDWINDYFGLNVSVKLKHEGSEEIGEESLSETFNSIEESKSGLAMDGD